MCMAQRDAIMNDRLDWDMVSKLKDVETKTIVVTLKYAGRGKPLPDKVSK